VRGVAPERDDQARINQLDLTHQIRLATFDFVRLRIAIAGRAAFENIRYVHFLARKPERLDHRIQQLTGATDEGLALPIFIGARGFADKKPLRLPIADAEDGLRAGRMQGAARTRGNGSFKG